jgi:hypothetical protein
MSKNKLLLSNEEGSIAILVAFLLTIFIAFMGLAVDFGYAYLQKSRLQKVADAQALACVISPASAPCPANGSNLYPELNPYGFTVTTVNPGDNSLCLNPAKQTKCARATAQITWNTFFINLFGVNTLNLSATALAARAIQPSCITATGLGDNVIKLDGADISLANCNVSSAGNVSTSGSNSFITGGNVTAFNESSCPNLTNKVGVPQTICTSLSAPLPQIPIPSIPTLNLNGQPLIDQSSNSCFNSNCNPGIYSDLVTFSQNTVLKSGVYIFNGGLQIAKNITLSNSSGGVSIFVASNSNIDLAPGVNINLIAPSTPGCSDGSGIVLSHLGPQLQKKPITLQNAAVLKLEGVANLTANDLVMNGTNNSMSIIGSLITNSLVLNGSISSQSSPNPCFNLYEPSGKPVLID